MVKISCDLKRGGALGWAFRAFFPVGADPPQRRPCPFCSDPQVPCYRCQWMDPSFMSEGFNTLTQSLFEELKSRLLGWSDEQSLWRKSLSRLGLWSDKGSQTPVTSPVYYQQETPSKTPYQTDPSEAGGVLLSYMEGHSVVPDRILKLMQLIMHHKVSTNAFEAVVKYDPRNWPMYRTGMHTPQCYPPTPERQKLYHHHVDCATLQLLQGVRDKLETL